MLASRRVGAEGPKEECGVFGVWAPGDDVARLTYFALFAQQHRGQEAAGMAVSDGEHILVFKELGLVSQVFDEATLSTLRGDLGIGHNRYSTTGSTTWENAQPAFKTDGQRSLALGHNGNLVNTLELAERGRAPGARPPPTPTWSRRSWPGTRRRTSSRRSSRCSPRSRARSRSS